MGRSLIDITGKKFGTRTVKRRAKNDKWGHPRWKSVCQCGSTSITSKSNLLKSESCGCLAREQSSTRMKTHGLTNSSEFSSWNSMVTRCTNKKRDAYEKYSKLGICEKWVNSFSAFIADMGMKPGRDYSIERIDNKKGYFPENCKWATRMEQGANMETNLTITHNGITMTASNWSRSLGAEKGLVRDRIARGWSNKRAVMTPSDTKHHRNTTERKS